MIAVKVTPIPHTRVGFLKWYAEHFPKMPHKSLIKICNPYRAVIDTNERIVAVMKILEDGIETEDEIEPLLNVVKDEEDFPIFTGTRDNKENNALLRGDAALALAKYGFKTTDFIDTLKQIIDEMIKNPLFIPTNSKGAIFFNPFLASLYLTDGNYAERIMKEHQISKEEIEKTYLSQPSKCR